MVQSVPRDQIAGQALDSHQTAGPVQGRVSWGRGATYVGVSRDVLFAPERLVVFVLFPIKALVELLCVCFLKLGIHVGDFFGSAWLLIGQGCCTRSSAF